jgi:hypothetical protein
MINDTLIIELADKLGQTVEYIGTQFISHQQFSGIYTLCAVVLFIMLGYYIMKKYPIETDNYNDMGEIYLAHFVRAVIYCVLFIILSGITHDAMVSILFPEYTGLREMIALIR